MCFSAQASFTAATVLAAIGYKTVKKASSRAEIFLAIVPLLFAIQQFCEGLIWIHFSYESLSQPLFELAKYGYLFFAFLVWPVWYPLSILMIETDPLRKKLIAAFLALGIVLAFYYIYAGFLNNHINVQIVHYRLQYIPKINFDGYIPLYLMSIIMPFFLSNYPHIRWVGWPGLISFVIATYYFEYALVSVWCFSASLISILILKVLHDNAQLQNREGDSLS